MPKEQSISFHQLLIVILIAGFILSCDSSVGPNHTTFDPGPILFVSDKSGTNQLWSMEEDGSNVKQLTHDPDFTISDARWSPDGNFIAVTGPADPGNLDEFASAIFVMNADGSNIRKVTFPPLGHSRGIGDGGPVWSPDGDKIAFTRLIPPEALGITNILIVDLETGEEKLVSEAARNVDGWYPDGERLLIRYFKDPYSRKMLAIIDTNGNILKDLTSPDTTVNSAILSPGGDKIAMSYSAELYIMDSNGENLQKIRSAIYRDFIRTWSPDSDRIIYTEEHKREKAFTQIPQYLKMMNLSTREELDISPFNYQEMDYNNTYRVTSWHRR